MGNVPKPGGRSASPAGSVDSSVASAAAASSTSPVTSRSSSPPTSPGGGPPSALLASTLPDDGGPGAATPSSTRAEAGEETSELSVPSTPIAGHNFELPSDMSSPHYDLVPSNLKLAAAEQMERGLSSQSAPRSFAPSVSSSLAAQFDPSLTSSEEQQAMLNDVSGISTPMGTPRAARRDLEGSARGEGSVAGDGDMEDLGTRLEGLGVEARHRDLTPGPDREDDPNKAADLEALKAGELAIDKPNPSEQPIDPNPVNSMAEVGNFHNLAEHVIPDDEKRKQGGEAGKRTGDEMYQSEVQPPSPPGGYEGKELTAGGTKGGTQGFQAEYVGTDETRGLHTQSTEGEHGEDGDTPSADATRPDLDRTRDQPSPAPDERNSNDTDSILPAPESAAQDQERTLSHKPIQVHLEPAPIAQPASDDSALEATPVSRAVDDEPPSEHTSSPTFPSAPKDDPDALQPIDKNGPSRTGASTPIDPSFLKSFPDVPDEDKPRVEVHVSSSPANTPQKARSSSTVVPETPLADLPGHSKSLANPRVEDQQGSGGRNSLSLDVDITPQEGLVKRLSTRKSPKSPLLGDEDPGDFEPGEGWAVVTQ